MALSESYKDSYYEAVDLMKGGKLDTCIDAAKCNLANPTLSRHWIVKNLLLIANVTADWYESEACRRDAEHIWAMADRETSYDDEAANVAVDECRAGLDALQKDLLRQEPEDFSEMRFYEWLGEEEDEDDDILKPATTFLPSERDPEYRLWGSEAHIRHRLEEMGTAVAAARIASKERATHAVASKQEEEEAATAAAKQEEEKVAAAPAKQKPTKFSPFDIELRRRLDASEQRATDLETKLQQQTRGQEEVLRRVEALEKERKTSAQEEWESLKRREWLADEEAQSLLRSARDAEEEAASLKRRADVAQKEQQALKLRAEKMA